MYRLWIVSHREKRIVYARTFPHLEVKDGFMFPKTTPEDFVQSLFESLGIQLKGSSASSLANQSISSRDSMASLSTTLTSKDGFSSPGLSRTLSSSMSSLNSIVSSTTTTTTSIRQATNQTTTEQTFHQNDLALNNCLPLVVCKFIKDGPRENVLSTDPERQTQLTVVNLIMLIHEQNGYLFVCCPRIKHLEYENELDFDQLLVEEDNISLSYTAMHLLANNFFKTAKSIKNIELFITACMPFGLLINEKIENNNSRRLVQSSSSNSKDRDYLVQLCINEMLSSSFKTQFSSDKATRRETLFGTLSVDTSALRENIFGPARMMLTVDNLQSLVLAKPFNCDIANLTSLLFELRYNNDNPLSVVNYRMNTFEEMPTTSPAFDRRLFTYHYTICKRQSTGNSFITSNLYHTISLAIQFHPRMSHDIKFSFFNIKFSLSDSKSDRIVQTLNNSVVNLIARDTIKASQGQVRNENKNFVWFVGQKMPKSGRMTLEFDMLINEENLDKLDVECLFKAEGKFSIKMAPKVGDEGAWKEARLSKYPSNIIDPCLKLSLVTISQPFSPRQSPTTQSTKQPAASNNNIVLLFDCRLSSFKYKLTPVMSK